VTNAREAFAVIELLPPNKALHRTPSASPLAPVSFQAFGDFP